MTDNTRHKRRRLGLDLSSQFQLQCPCCYRPGAPFCGDCDPATSIQRLAGLRALMVAHALDAYIITSVDAHSSEYIAEADERRRFLTGFSGSAGTALVTASKALLWTDSRYFLQAEKQLEGTEWILMRQFSLGVLELKEWVLEHLSAKIVGVDPALVPAETSEEWKLKWESRVTIKEIGQNLVDAIWTTRPDEPCNAIEVHPLEFAGETVTSKLQRVREAFGKQGAEAMILSALDQIAWLFNLRGSDIECNPVFFSYAALTTDGAFLFVRASEQGRDGLSKEVQAHLDQACVSARPYSQFFSKIGALLAEKRVLLEPSSCSSAILSLVHQERRILDVSPVARFKAVKNKQEIEGLINACRRDSLALCETLALIEERLVRLVEQEEPMSEIHVSEIIAGYRRKQLFCVGDSFPTIASSGANSAVVHYRPEPGSCKILEREQILLIDTGGQYKDGTTDVTRTVHFGEPTPEQKRIFTRVLQGHVALATAVFPTGTPGIMLDSYARQPLWRDGLQYGHGTGHGMGAYLNVHEGPFGIGGGTVPGNKIQENERMKRLYLMPIEAGNFVSNEPGCYKDGEFGIRIEADLVAVPAETPYQMGGRPFLRFDYLTLVPICRELVDATVLTASEEQWLDEYHNRVWDSVKDSLSSRAREWLRKSTRPLRAAGQP